MAFAFIGDIHLEKKNVEPFASVTKQPEQVRHSLNAVRKVFKWCQKNGIKEVVIGGDLFDSAYPSQSALVKLGELLAEFPGIRVIVIPGNHDMVSYDEHSLSVLGWVGRKKTIPLELILTPTLMTIDKHKCWVVPHPFHTDPPKGVDWCIGHFPWTGAKRDNGTIAMEGKFANPKGRWLLGDFHTHQRGKNFIYAGSLTQLNRMEQGPKGFLVVDGDSVKFIEIEKDYHIRSFTMTDPKQLAGLADNDNQAPVYWWIYIEDPDVVMPQNWAIDYPHVLDYTPPSTRKDKTVEAAQLVFSKDPLEPLAGWLVNRTTPKLAKKVIKMARSIHGKAK